MESKGKYVWDPEKQTWVRPSELSAETTAAPPARPAVPPARKSKPAEPLVEPSVEAVAEREPVVAAVEAEPHEDALEYALEDTEFEYIGAGRRATAMVIDLVVAFIISAPFPYILGEGTVASVIVSHVFVLLYLAGMWAWRGQTLGKMIIGIKVVSADGGPVSIVKAFIRGTIFFVYYVPATALGVFLIGISGVYLFVGLVIVIVLMLIKRSETKMAPHDRIAGTRVISARDFEFDDEDYEYEDEDED
ncbi:MAG: RDD family protein [Dehalococcoidia bacterium]